MAISVIRKSYLIGNAKKPVKGWAISCDVLGGFEVVYLNQSKKSAISSFKKHFPHIATYTYTHTISFHT